MFTTNMGFSFVHKTILAWFRNSQLINISKNIYTKKNFLSLGFQEFRALYEY